MNSFVRSISQHSLNLLNSQYGHKKLVNIVEHGTDYVVIRKVNNNSNLLLKERFENFLNFIKEKFYNFLYITEKCLFKMIVYLLTIWISAAILIYFFESSEDINYKNNENDKQVLNVLRMINNLEKIQNNKFYSKKEWEREIWMKI
ncbi:Hypothetical protein SRAE_2000247000 [Strongyloides ratti]|uniref:Uncharacterized protein n=1 Tax=Strongyloides ratti TaxID=34506 RepID=A0A090LI51_STRRB|nr:Hypothetical protein SRAE_2000247000 [Strongyloides ratti]CEF67808.1 Hypothetical protein SRAE_2000247000 [Strongyloides ratti]